MLRYNELVWTAYITQGHSGYPLMSISFTNFLSLEDPQNDCFQSHVIDRDVSRVIYGITHD